MTIPEEIIAAAAHPKRKLLVYTQSGSCIEGSKIISSLLTQINPDWNQSIELHDRYYFRHQPNINPKPEYPFMIVIYPPELLPNEIRSVQHLQSISHKIAMFMVNSLDDHAAQKITLRQNAEANGYTAVMFYTSEQTVENLHALDPLFTPSPPNDLRVHQQLTTLLSLSMLIL